MSLPPNMVKKKYRPLPPVALWPVLAVLAAAATLFSWVRSADRTIAATKPYTATFTFDDTTPVADRTVYEDGEVNLDDPIFLKVASAVDVSLDLALNPGEVQLSGTTLATRVVVSSSTGWSHTLVPAKETAFTGDAVTTKVHVDFAEAQRRAAEIDSAAGASGGITVSVVSTLAAKASLDGNPADAAVHYTTGVLSFDVTDTVAKLGNSGASSGNPGLQGLTPGSASASSNTGGPSAGGTENSTTSIAPGVQQATGSVPAKATKAATVSIGPSEVKVTDLRTWTTIVLVLVLLILGYNALMLRLAQQLSEAEYLAMRYEPQLFPLMHVSDDVRQRAVVLGTFEALMAVSQDAEAAILYNRGDTENWFYVFDGPNVFAYRAKPSWTSPLGDPFPDQ